MRKYLPTPAEISEQRKLRAIASHWRQDPDNQVTSEILPLKKGNNSDQLFCAFAEFLQVV